ncbi:hypothetical protein ACJJH9_12185 [Microbulbifer sp. DLAB2-AF]|uniref:GTA baseplate fiber-binding domain-containing protein n=1 Tax=Microbulbifer sp. DLAB2-AF TaxID=3243395 RepID=UPI0040392E38
MAPPAPVPGSTYIQFIDTPILASDDDLQLGYYVAVAGSNGAWAGATVSLSLEGGQNYIESDNTDIEAVIGELTTSLANQKREIPDTHNRVQLRLYDTGYALENCTLADLLNRQNRALIGNEIVSFGEVEEISPGVWELGYFLRGRLGTAPANLSAHRAPRKWPAGNSMARSRAPRWPRRLRPVAILQWQPGNDQRPEYRHHRNHLIHRRPRRRDYHSQPAKQHHRPRPGRIDQRISRKQTP